MLRQRVLSHILFKKRPNSHSIRDNIVFHRRQLTIKSCLCNKLLKIAFACIIICLTIILAYYFIRHIDEEREIERYIEAKGISVPKKINKDFAFLISDIVRRDFNSDSSTWKHLDLRNRPFFRNSTHELLKIKEGACGEGTRAIIKILLKLGFNATRVTLYDKHLNPAHTLISLKIEGKEYFVDSINSPKELNEYLRSSDINSSVFNFIPINQIFEKRERTHINGFEKFTEDYIIYAYEAIPFTRIVSSIFEVHVFNFERPGKFISYIAESYYLLNGLTVFFLLAAVTMIFFVWMRLCKKHGTTR